MDEEGKFWFGIWSVIALTITTIVVSIIVFASRDHIQNVSRDKYLVDHCQILRAETLNGSTSVRYKCTNVK